MTIGAAIFFSALLALATPAIRWISQSRQWRVVGLAMVGLVTLVALHDVAVSGWFENKSVENAGLAIARSPWRAADIHALLTQQAPHHDDGQGTQGDGRWQLMRLAIAQARNEAASAPDHQRSRLSDDHSCVGNEIASLLGVGVSGARGGVPEEWVAPSCWARDLPVLWH